SANPHELSAVELVERLAIALQRRQKRLGSMPGHAQNANDALDSPPAPGEAPNAAPEPGRPVIRLPGLADRQRAHLALSVSAPAPQETEKALREALAELQRMSGRA